jgi:hypothetical protein
MVERRFLKEFVRVRVRREEAVETNKRINITGVAKLSNGIISHRHSIWKEKAIGNVAPSE